MKTLGRVECSVASLRLKADSLLPKSHMRHCMLLCSVALSSRPIVMLVPWPLRCTYGWSSEIGSAFVAYLWSSHAWRMKILDNSKVLHVDPSPHMIRNLETEIENFKLL
eukprot:2236562-Amphidinium_carterae.1